MNNYVEGRVKAVLPTKNLDGGAFINAFVLEYESGGYTNEVYFEGWKKPIPEGVAIGNYVKVYFNVRSKAWKDKYINSINYWKVDLISTSGQATVQDYEIKPNDQWMGGGSKNNDDVPF